jgi:hypothetical protein
MSEPAYRLKMSAKMRYEWQVRCIADVIPALADGAAWDVPTFATDRATVEAIAADCEHMADPRAVDASPGERAAYRGLLRQCRALLADSAPDDVAPDMLAVNFPAAVRVNASDSTRYTWPTIPALDAREEDYRVEFSVHTADPDTEARIAAQCVSAMNAAPQVVATLRAAYAALDSVAFLQTPGDTDAIKERITGALRALGIPGKWCAADDAAALVQVAQSRTDYALSRAETEAALAPVVAHMRSLDPAHVPAYVANVRAGTVGALALHLYKEKRAS